MSKPKLFIFAGVSLAIIGGAIFAWRLGYFIKISEFFAAEQTLTIKTITNTHRYDPGKMFGGWGSHLGHLLRAPDGSLWFADDTGNDVNINPAIAYYHFVDDQWSPAGILATIGTVQQNMGSVIDSNSTIFSYGIDVANHRIEECYFNTRQDYKGCNLLPFGLGPNANYIGAALTPSGYKIVWWTNVVDGGGGSLQYIYNFGGGWNGPITSNVGGYNNASYINIAFENDTHFVMNAEGVSGNAPNWGYVGMFGEGDIGSPISNWQILNQVLVPADIWIDSAQGAHVLALTQAGTIAYFYRAKGGAILFVTTLSGNNRVRFVDSDDGKIHLIQEKSYGILQDRAYQKTDILGSIPLESITPSTITLPAGFGYTSAIYPESRIYQTTPVQGINVALNGNGNEGNVTHVQINSSLFTPIPTVTTTITSSPIQKPGDLDSDGDVDIFDYNKLISDFGKSGVGLAPDIDKDGDVDIFDYNKLIENFGR